jgi:hypothetical protein
LWHSAARYFTCIGSESVNQRHLPGDRAGRRRPRLNLLFQDLQLPVRFQQVGNQPNLQIAFACDDAVQSAAIAPDGSCLVSDSRDGGIIVWRPDSQRRLNSLRLARAPVDSVAVSRDGKRLTVAAGSWMSLATGYVALWDLASLLEHEGLEGHSAVGAVVFHEDGRSLVVGEWSGRITVWNLLTRLPAGVGFVPRDVISSARFSADTQSLSHIDPAAVPAAHVPRDAAGGASAEFGEQPASVLDDLRPALRGTPR